MNPLARAPQESAIARRARLRLFHPEAAEAESQREEEEEATEPDPEHIDPLRALWQTRYEA